MYHKRTLLVTRVGVLQLTTNTDDAKPGCADQASLALAAEAHNDTVKE
jgi:hypothetical protein